MAGTGTKPGHRQGLDAAVTPKLIPARPVHRWFWFPHSYSPELVEALLEAWDLPHGAAVLDPFVGAGTTLRVALERGYSAVGADLSPLAVLASNVKIRTYRRSELEAALEVVKQRLEEIRSLRDLEHRTQLPPTWCDSRRMMRAFTPSELAVLAVLREAIQQVPSDLQDFFFVAAVGILPEFSRAVADGGWFRWRERPEQPERILPRFLARVESMLDDISVTPEQGGGTWEALLLDARDLSALAPRVFDALITSPPYPNRHDYSRIFHIELLFLGYSEEEIAALRHHSLRSHVEARPPGDRPLLLSRYMMPTLLKRCLGDLPGNCDGRLRRMLQGYFEDLFLVLQGAHTILKPQARAGLVVGNVRYGGTLFPVDRILTDIGRQAGFRHVETWTLRRRGNSAQQMGRYGKVPSRESVVIMEAV